MELALKLELAPNFPGVTATTSHQPALSMQERKEKKSYQHHQQAAGWQGGKKPLFCQLFSTCKVTSPPSEQTQTVIQ